jgi:hypothetical protein
MASELAWTGVRSPVMVDQKRDGYKLSLKLGLPFAVISRRAVANCLLDQLTDTHYLQKAPIIRQK